LGNLLAASPVESRSVDPVLVYSTFLGGAEGNPDDDVSHVAVDRHGNLFVTGTTGTRDFPTVNAHQPTCALGRLGGCQDIFVAKFDPGGLLMFSTYLGSSGNDQSGGIAVDTDGNAYLTGTWDKQAFMAKLDSNGRLLFHHTFPGSPNSHGRAIAIDQKSNIYLAGETFSFYPVGPFHVWPPSGFLAPPRKPSCFAIGGGSFAVDAFVVKLDSLGRTIFSVALGGNGNDFGTDIAADSAGNVWVTGGAGSADFPTKDPLQAGYGGGEGQEEGKCTSGDVFVVKIDPTGSELLYSTFLGGESTDRPHSIEVDPEGNAYVVWTGASEALDSRLCPWVTKLDPSGQHPLYAVCLQNAEPEAAAVDPFGNLFLTGAGSLGMPIIGAFQESLAGGSRDAFVAKLDPSGALRFSSYLGGASEERGKAIAVGAVGEIYLAGATDSENFPTLNPAQAECAPDFRGGCSVDGFIAKIKVSAPEIRTAAAVSSASFTPQLPLAADSIASVFGEGLAEATEAASTLPLPTTLAGTAIHVADATGGFHRAELFFVSPTQINFLTPPSLPPGAAEVLVVRQGEPVARAPLQISVVSPALFAANARGQGPAAALALKSGGELEPTFQCVTVGDCTVRPIDLGHGPVVVVLFGTGIRGCSSLEAVSVHVGGIEVPVTFAGPQPGFAGLDQINIGPLPAALAGRGEVGIRLTVHGSVSNTVTAAFD
jgi:uncharacterized protein (TIGR03437 family)